MVASLNAMRDPGRSLFWTRPPPASSELATEDPLAFDYISQQIGLWLLPALTTRSSRAQAFALVLYGLHLAEIAAQRYGQPATDAACRELFERWERFWALATVESRDGDIPRGDPDAMRGVRGALQAWRPGVGALALDFPLISRQQELANLGAYLSPLRRAGLVIEGTLRPSAAGLDIVDAFWDETDNKQRGRYHDYALLALDPRKGKIERTNGALTLAKVGRRSRLTVLTARPRQAQQRRLYDALFGCARDSHTLAVSRLVEAAARAGVTAPRAIIAAALAERLGAISDELRDLLVTAHRFGDAMDASLRAFDRVYRALADRGWTGGVDAVAAEAIDPPTLASLQRTSAGLVNAPAASRIRGLPMHGAACMRLAEALIEATSSTALHALLTTHHGVQRERRRGEGWLRADGPRMTLLVSSYSARPEADRFPSFKLDTVRSLLIDTGRLPTGAPDAVFEGDE
jgi:hypothetical protein